MKLNPPLLRTKKADVPVKPAPSLLNLVLKPWKPNLKKLNKLPPQRITNSKMLKENARSLKAILNVLSNVLRNSKAKHVTSKPKSVNKKVKSRKLKLSLSRMPKKKTNTKPKSEDSKKNSNWLILVLNSLKDQSTSSNQPLMVFLKLSWTKRSITEIFLKNSIKPWTTWCPCNNLTIAFMTFTWRHFFTFSVSSPLTIGKTSRKLPVVEPTAGKKFSLLVESNSLLMIQAADCIPVYDLSKAWQSSILCICATHAFPCHVR